MDLTKILGTFMAAVAVLGLVFLSGYFYSSSVSAPKYAALRAKLDAADSAAKEEVKRQKENEHAIAKELDDSVARINARYDGMLQRGREDHARTVAKCTQAINGTPEEHEVAGGWVEFERACALDANSLRAWQRWAVLNRIPIGD